MASISVPFSASGTVVSSGLAPVPDGPAHVKVVTGTGKRVNYDFVGLAVADALPFAVNDSVTVASDGTNVTLSK